METLQQRKRGEYFVRIRKSVAPNLVNPFQARKILEMNDNEFSCIIEAGIIRPIIMWEGHQYLNASDIEKAFIAWCKYRELSYVGKLWADVNSGFSLSSVRERYLKGPEWEKVAQRAKKLGVYVTIFEDEQRR